MPLFRLVCLSGCVCVTFVFFTDCESCAVRGLFPQPGIYGSGGVWANAWDVFVARCLEVVAVAGLLWISWCVLDAAGFRVFKFVDPEQSASTR